MNESATVQLVQNSENTTCTVALLYAILLSIRRELAQARHVTAQAVDVSHCEFGLSLLSDSEQVEHGVGAATHGNIKSHGIEESVASGYAARQHALVAVLIVGEGVLHNLACSCLEEFDTVLVSCEDGAVARQSHTDSLGKRVHGIGCEHARAASASRTRALLNLLQFVVGNGLVGTLDHSCDEVGILAVPSSSLHRSARAEHGRDVKAHRRHKHTRSNLVAIGNANHSISLVGVDHVFHRVGDNVARRQRIQHTVVSHSDTVVNGDGVELGSIATHTLNFLLHNLSNLMQMCVTWHKLCERVDNSNNGLAKLFVFHTCGDPKSASSCHTAAFGTHCAS